MKRFAFLYKKVTQYFGNAPIKIVQVGAHVGGRKDPLFYGIKNLGWNGILIEPLSEEFKTLKEEYKQFSGLTFENVAIHDQLKKIKFYVDNYRRDCSSVFKTKNINGHRKHISKITIPCCTLNEILKKHNFFPDLLQIDVEGSELSVLKSLDLDKYRPRIIHYEHKHIERLGFGKEVRNMLKNHGYQITKINLRDSLAEIP